MRKNLFHIFLSLFLSIVVADYLWVELFNEDHIVAELETEKEKEKEAEEEKLRETETEEDKIHLHGSRNSKSAHHNLLPNLSSGFFKIGNSFEPHKGSLEPALFILYHQLKLHC